MVLRKILFWLVWIPLSPIVWAICGGGRTYHLDYVEDKVGRIKQAVWEKYVLRKAEERQSLNEYKRRHRL